MPLKSGSGAAGAGHRQDLSVVAARCLVHVLRLFELAHQLTSTSMKYATALRVVPISS